MLKLRNPLLFTQISTKITPKIPTFFFPNKITEEEKKKNQIFTEITGLRYPLPFVRGGGQCRCPPALGNAAGAGGSVDVGGFEGKYWIWFTDKLLHAELFFVFS